jgi:hypothetical protein
MGSTLQLENKHRLKWPVSSWGSTVWLGGPKKKSPWSVTYWTDIRVVKSFLFNECSQCLQHFHNEVKDSITVVPLQLQVTAGLPVSSG